MIRSSTAADAKLCRSAILCQENPGPEMSMEADHLPCICCSTSYPRSAGIVSPFHLPNSELSWTGGVIPVGKEALS